MIKFETKHGTSSLEMEGTTSEILADVTSFLKAILKSVEEEDEELADYIRHIYKDVLMNVVLAEDESTKIKHKEKKEKEEKEKVEQVDKLIKELDDILSLLEIMKKS